MGICYADRHIKSMSLARTCVDLGAHVKAVTCITGLPAYVLANFFFDDDHSPPRGRLPSSYEWFHNKANFVDKVEASIFAAIYSQVTQSECEPGEALVTAYRLYVERCTGKPRISFDRAFDLVSHLQGIWLRRQPDFTLQKCAECMSKNLMAIGELCNSTSECLFCKLVKRYPIDKRMQSIFPERQASDAIGRGAETAVLFLRPTNDHLPPLFRPAPA